MSDGLNRWTGVGHLVEDPSLRFTQGGQAVLNFRIACNESYLDRNDERKERVEYVSAALWGKRGEALVKYLSKGSKVYVEGSLRTETYEKNGEKRYATKINVSNVILCGGGSRKGAAETYDGSTPEASSGGAGGGGRGSAEHMRAAATHQKEHAETYESYDDDIPFVVDMTLRGAWWRP